MKKFLFIMFCLCSVLSLTAQTDMTSRIANPSFEDEREGWEIHDMGCQKNDAFKKKVGNVYLETWTGRGGHVRDCRISQEVRNLPAGTYTLSCVAQNIQEDTPSAKQTGVWLTANDDKVEVGVAKTYSARTTIVDGKLTIGFKAVGATGNYVCVDDFHLTLEEPTEETYAVFRSEIAKLVKEAESMNQHLDTPEQRTLDAAVTEAQAVLDGDQTKDVAAVYLALRDAIYNYHFALATPENPLDVTDEVLNPGFENSTKFWTNNGFSAQGNDAFGLKVGAMYLEIYGWASTPVADADIYQDVKLPNGRYRMTAVAQNVLESNKSAKQRRAYIYGNSSQTEVSQPKTYEVEFVVCDGVARIGCKTAKCTGSYVCFDDIHLYYIGMDNAALFTELNKMISEADGLLTKHFDADLKAALQNAVDEAKTVTDAANITAAGNALRQAIDPVKASITMYADFLKNIQTAEKSYAKTLANGGDEFKAVIDYARALYDAAHMTAEEMDEQSKLLHKAEVLYFAANGTGTVPTVITYNFVPEGATGALGRLKVKGVSASRIKYQGFCWSKHPNPTLADDFVTEGEKLYDYPGLIYVMEPLEPATEYYCRAFAMTTGYQVGYGEVRRIITLPMGQCTWSYAYNGEEGDNERLAYAAEGAMWYYNHWTNIENYGITVNFDPGDETAHCSYGGWMTVGPNASYQRIGTLMHEAGHGIGHGQIGQWGALRGNVKFVAETTPDGGIMGPCANGGEVPHKKNAVIDEYDGWWRGIRSNMMVHFLTDGQDIANGDWAHCGPFGINGAGADNGTRILYIANALEIQGMGEDGMPPSGGSATPYYSFESRDTVLYYLSNEKYGLGTSFLTESATGTLKSVKATAEEVLGDSAYAWNIIYQPQTCYYLIRNAKSGKYFTYSGSTFKTAVKAEPGAKESFHLMPSRYNVRLGDSGQPVKVRSYWIMEGNRRKWDLATISQTSTSGKTTAVAQDFLNDDTEQQRWLILTAAQVKAIDDATSIESPMAEEETLRPADGRYYDLMGRPVSRAHKGIYIVDGKKCIQR